MRKFLHSMYKNSNLKFKILASYSILKLKILEVSMFNIHVFSKLYLVKTVISSSNKL